jgi:predicted ester cyclase
VSDRPLPDRPLPDRALLATNALRYLRSFETGVPETIASHVTEEFVNEHASALGAPCQGRSEYLRRLPGFLASMPALRYEAGDPLVDGDRVAAPYTLHAQGTTPTGEVVPIEIRGVMLLRFDGPLIASRLDVWDALTYLRQTGQA